MRTVRTVRTVRFVSVVHGHPSHMDPPCLLLLLAASLCFVSSSSETTQKSTHFVRCAEPGIIQAGILRNVSMRMVGCFVQCAADDNCKSLNVCPSTSGQDTADCQLLASYSQWFCQPLVAEQHGHCFHAEKTTKCLNGGRLRQNDTCRCDFAFKGSVCESYTRDCKEAKDLIDLETVKYPGTAGDVLDRFIKPSNALHPFLVRCSLNYRTTTVLIRVQEQDGRSQINWAELGWSSYEAGVGSLAQYNYFIGLRNLHLLLKQAKYRVTLYNTYYNNVASSVQPSFGNVTVADSCHDYALSYSVYTDSNGLINTGLQNFAGANTPHPFCTADKPGRCTCASKGPGWYSGNCSEYSPFAAVAKWPNTTLGPLIIKDTQYPFERDGDFY